MAAHSTNIDVIIDVGDREIPVCPHGPALLFVRYGGGDSGRKFFACSAFRDRKECSFFQWEDEEISEKKKKIRSEFNRHNQPKFCHQELYKRFQEYSKLSNSDRHLCHSCGLFLLPGELEGHRGHKLKSPILDDSLKKPTELFLPLDNNKTYAQYLFSNTAVDFTVKILGDLSFTHVVCIGAPRIYEAIKLNTGSRIQGLLLDLDHRYQQLYSTSELCRYNMFNHHFFDRQQSKVTYDKFISEKDKKRVVIIMDPPFGGMVEALAATYHKISQEWKTLSNKSGDSCLPMLWFFPYFMEKRIQDCLPEFHMLDYKVDYDNHALFRGDTKKYGSPVRIFTNLPAEAVVLPKSEGYWFCEICRRYSARENLHCDMCEKCPSKDGRTYRHCFKCERCVKPSKKHCDVCKTCQQQDHKCGETKPKGCHICGALDHKRKDCSQLRSNAATKRGLQQKTLHLPTKRKKKF